MRNLSILAQKSFAVQGEASTSAVIQSTACSTEDDTIYAVSVSRTSSNVKLSFLRCDPSSSSLVPFSSIVTPAAPAPLPSSAASIATPQQTGRPTSELVSFHFLSDGGSAANHNPALCIITAGGDIILLPLSDAQESDQAPDPDPEIVGSVEQGLLAASWSPDDELLVLITAEQPEELSDTGRRQVEKILLMTREFEVLSESVLRTDDFGEERPVDVGWGSKATQFHGSEGKAAAAAKDKSTTDTRGPHLPDDDGRPRISWRGDGAFFAISSLEPFRSHLAEIDALPTWHRLIRTYARLGALSATSDPAVRGISQALAFRPTGNLIASTQRFGASLSGDQWAQGRAGRHDVVFFERNGLRHGEFSLREEGTVQPAGVRVGLAESQAVSQWARSHYIRELAWNSDASALAIWLTRCASAQDEATVDVVQVWTTGNYHWYLKQETIYSASDNNVQQIKWHPERPHDLLIATSRTIEHKSFYHETSTSGGRPPFDAACVAVTDGSATLLTLFRMQNVPPPMCTTSLLHPPVGNKLISGHDTVSVPVHYSWSQLVASDQAVGLLTLLFQTGQVQLWRFDWGLLGGRSKIDGKPVATPRLVAVVDAGDVGPSQVAVAGWAPAACGFEEAAKVSVAVLGTGEVRLIDVLIPAGTSIDAAAKVEFEHSVVLPPSSSGKRRLVSDPFVHKAQSKPAFYVHNDDGTILSISKQEVEPLTTLGAFCTTLQMIARPNGQPSRVVGLATNGKLFTNSHLVAKDATSFTLAGSFLVWTNSAHEARFAPVASLPFDDQKSTAKAPEESIDLSRRIERGSRIVTAVPSLMALVLQMPRGNLETICPRLFVLEVVRRDLNHQRYGSAFRTCRTHRMDVNILYDHDPDSFMKHIDKFVAQVADVDHINLFLSGLRNEDVTAMLYKPLTGTERSNSTENKVNRICDAVRSELEKVDNLKYVNSILTTYVRKVPADYESGLSLLLELKEQDQALAEEAVKYIIFLADAEKLFNLALGMYDFTLTLMVAQHAQRKDPREYLPFLRELRGLEPVEYQRFKIDDHLKRHAKALTWLIRAGKQHHQAALQYMDQHKLYADGIKAWSNDPSQLRDAHDLFGEYLLTRRKYVDAALCFTFASKPRKALRAYREALAWPEAFSIAFSEKFSPSEIVKMAREIASELEDKLRWQEAARVILEYGRDLEQAVHYYCKGNDFASSHRLCATYNRTDLLQTHISPALLDSQNIILEDLEEMTFQFSKQLERISELRIKKTENPLTFYGQDDPALENVDVMSDTSTQMTMFTRYTSAPSVTASTMSTFSSVTKSTSKKALAQRKKEERKKARGKKGSVYEEDYLYESVQKLVKERLGSLQNEAAKLLPHLVVMHRAAGKELQQEVERFEKKATEAIETLWSYSIEDDKKKAEQMNHLETDILNGTLISAGPTVLAMAVRSVDRRAPRPKLLMAENKYKLVLFD